MNLRPSVYLPQTSSLVGIFSLKAVGIVSLNTDDIVARLQAGEHWDLGLNSGRGEISFFLVNGPDLLWPPPPSLSGDHVPLVKGLRHQSDNPSPPSAGKNGWSHTSIYSRTPIIRISWDGETSGYAKLPDN
jgi:hypothetical protein